jgi:fructose-1-phosphate kinase PfkB-like protein
VHWFSVRHRRCTGSPPQVSVASTVGAGDSLLAGMLHGLLSGRYELNQTLRTATAIAAMAVTQIGFGITDAAQLKRSSNSGVRCAQPGRRIREVRHEVSHSHGLPERQGQ